MTTFKELESIYKQWANEEAEANDVLDALGKFLATPNPFLNDPGGVKAKKAAIDRIREEAERVVFVPITVAIPENTPLKLFHEFMSDLHRIGPVREYERDGFNVSLRVPESKADFYRKAIEDTAADSIKLQAYRDAKSAA